MTIIDTVEKLKDHLDHYSNNGREKALFATDFCISKELSDECIDKFIDVLVRDYMASPYLNRECFDCDDTIILLDRGIAGTFYVNVRSGCYMVFYRSIALDDNLCEFDKVHPLFDTPVRSVLSFDYMLLDFDSQEEYKKRIKHTLEVLAL